MRLLLNAIGNERDRLHNNNVRLRCIGDIASLPKDVQNVLLDAMTMTQRNTGLTLILALSYSGRWDLTNAIKAIARDIEDKNFRRVKFRKNLFRNIFQPENIPIPI